MTLVAAEGRHRAVLQTIGKNSVPGLIAAQHIKVAMADMDAEAANELLAKPGEAKAAAKAYETNREEVAPMPSPSPLPRRSPMSTPIANRLKGCKLAWEPTKPRFNVASISTNGSIRRPSRPTAKRRPL